MEQTKVQIAKLNGTNYPTWKFKVELLLIKDGLWKVIKEDPPNPVTPEWNNIDDKARATIGLMVEDSQLNHIRTAKTAKESWTSLKNIHESTTITNKIMLMRKLFNMKLALNGNLETHIGEMLEMFHRLSSLNENFQQHIVVAIILSSLPENYDNLITALEGREEKDLTKEFIIEKLLDEYRRKLNGNASQADESVMKISKYDHKSKKPKPKCFNCGILGHFSRDCYKPKRNEQSSKPNRINGISEHDDEKQEGKPTSRPKCFGIKQLIYSGNQNNTGRNEKIWNIDSGATSHMCNNKKFITKWSSQKHELVRLADGRVVTCCGKGSGILQFNDANEKFIKVEMKNVMCVENLSENFISVGKLIEIGWIVSFDKYGCNIKYSENEAFATIKKSINNMYEIECLEKVSIIKELKHSNACQHQWHRKLGHRDPDAIKQLVNQKLADGIEMSDCGIRIVCDCCMKSKMTRSSFPKKSNSRTESPLELVHTDICGKMPVKTIGGKEYVLTIIDDFSRYTIGYLLTHKSETIQCIKEYVAANQNRFGKLPQIIRSDRGGEYISNEYKAFLKTNGIAIQYTNPYTPEQNGVAERKNRHLVEMTRSLLLDAGLENSYWGEAIMTAIYLQNRLPTSSTEKTPYELWFGKKPELDHLKIFGSKAYVFIPKEKRKKLDQKAELLTFIGYSEETKGYRFLNKRTNQITISKDAKFVEDPIGHSIDQDSDSEDINVIIDNEDNAIGYTEVQNDSDDDSDDYSEANDQLPNDNIQPLRRGDRTRKPPERFVVNSIQELEEPSTFKEAMSGPDSHLWKIAIDDEMASLIENKTWDLVQLPQDRKAIGCKWTFKIKRNPDGSIARRKARLVAQGFSQKYGFDYDEVFAPVVRHETLRILLAVAGKRKLIVKHYDVKTAFLYGDLEETIYMKQPEGFENGNYVCKLKKGLYGLKQSARNWNKKISSILLNNEFTQSKNDPCLFSKCVNGKWTYILIYVDDLIVASSLEADIDKIITRMKQHFQMSDLGHISYYLGLEIERDENGIFSIHQKGYIKKILKSFGQEDAKPSKIPMDPGYSKNEQNAQLLPDNILYQKLIGCLIFLSTKTRPDIALSTSILASKVSNPTEMDWTEAKRILRYLKGTIDLKLKLGNTDKNRSKLFGYCDADWAGSSDRKSISGYLFKLFGGTISWASRKQTCVALSSTESEYVALAEGCQETIWLRRLLEDFNEKQSDPTVILEDNQSCLKVAGNEKFSKRTKHIDTKFHFVKNYQEENITKYEYCPTEDMVADMLTKPLEAVKLKKFVQAAGLFSN